MSRKPKHGIVRPQDNWNFPVINKPTTPQGREPIVNPLDKIKDPFSAGVVPSGGSSSLGGATSGNVDPKYSKLLQLVSLLLGDSSYVSNFIGQIGKNSEPTDFLLQLLGIAGGNLNRIGLDDDDMQKQLKDMLLNYLAKQEQRTFDANALQEQRNYDSPSSQLARLMATGMSRDAAIQALQGTSDAPLVGSGADVNPGFEPAPSSTEQVLGGIQAGVSLLSGVGSLVSLGFSIPQALQQVTYLKNANFLTKSQIDAYDSAGTAFNILSAAGASAEAFGSVASASKALVDLANSGNTDAAEFIRNGGIDKMRKNASFASPTLSKLYRDERASSDYRKEFTLRTRGERLRNQLTQANIEETYQNISLAISETVKTDAEAQKIYQDLQRGDIEIQIAGERLVIARNEAAHAQFENDALDNALSRTDENGNNIVDFMGLDMFSNLWELFETASLKVGTPEQKAAFVEYLKNNQQAAFDLAFVQALCKRNMAAAYDENKNPNLSSIMQFWAMLRDSGVNDVLSTTARNAIEFYFRRHSKDFMP